MYVHVLERERGGEGERRERERGVERKERRVYRRNIHVRNMVKYS